MATIKVDMSQIEDHLAQRDSIIITSFNWSQRGFNSDPEIEWEFDSEIPDLEYEDEDLVEVDEFNKLREDYDQLDRSYDELKAEYDSLDVQYNLLKIQHDLLQAKLNTKPLWKFW